MALGFCFGMTNGMDRGDYCLKSRCSRNIPFFGKAFGVLECIVRSLFFTWTPALCKILTIGNLWKCHMVIWVGVVCVRIVERQWTSYTILLCV